MRVLLIEDEPGIAQFISQGLTEAGYVLDLVRDGKEGKNYALSVDYDTIILDISYTNLSYQNYTWRVYSRSLSYHHQQGWLQVL